MKKIFYSLSIFLFICVFISCNNGGQEEDSAKKAQDSNNVKIDSQKNDPSSGSIAPAINTADTKFMVDIAKAGMMEIELGKIAEERSGDETIKRFGAMMVTDHTKAAAALQKLASQKKVSLPSALDIDEQKQMDSLKNKSGKAFDQPYMKMMVDGHKKVLSELNDEKINGSDADVRDFASNTIATVQMHLDSARKDQQYISKK